MQTKNPKIGDRVYLPNNDGVGDVIALEGAPMREAWVSCVCAPSGYTYLQVRNGEYLTVKKYPIDKLEIVE